MKKSGLHTDLWLHFLNDHTNPEDALSMKKYMRGKFEYLGIKTNQRKELLAQMINRNPPEGIEETIKLVHMMWQSPYREYQYCAMELIDKKKKKLSPDHIGFIEYLITTGSWWDTVDLIASHLVGDLLNRHPELTEEVNNKWMKSGNLWLQRSCILFQLGYKKNTNVALLERNILELADHKDFFIRKAIGWALRQYARTDENRVKSFVQKNDGVLSPLSKREALKRIHSI